jgi:hypothetical protein
MYERKGDRQKAADDYATAKKLGYKQGEPFPRLPFIVDVDD